MYTVSNRGCVMEIRRIDLFESFSYVIHIADVESVSRNWSDVMVCMCDGSVEVFSCSYVTEAGDLERKILSAIYGRRNRVVFESSPRVNITVRREPDYSRSGSDVLAGAVGGLIGSIMGIGYDAYKNRKTTQSKPTKFKSR